MAGKLRLGIVGTGVAARELYLPAFRKLSRSIELTACCNRTRSKAEDYAKLAGIPRVVDDAEQLFALSGVDAVLLSLPIEVMPRYVLRALQLKKPVLSEKPVAPSVQAGKKLLRSAARYETPWLVGENFAFMEHADQLRRWLERGRLGAPRLVEVSQLTRMDAENPYFDTAWRTKPRFVGAFVVDAGVHLAHLVRTSFGMPTRVLALAANLDPGLPAPDTAVAALSFPGGALGSWRSCFSTDYDGPMMRVFGSKASAELHFAHATLAPRRGKAITYRAKQDSFTLQFQHFADIVKRGVAPRITPADALKDLELIEKIASPKRR
jgi:predicted dehydrogenase